MVHKMVKKSEFAELAGISPSAATKVCKSTLAGAMVGKRVDLNHSEVVKYLERKDLDKIVPTTVGMDPLYEKVVQHCQLTRKYSANSIKHEFKIGFPRAKAMVEVMAATGMIPSKSDKSVKAPPVEMKQPALRTPSGQEAGRTTKKQEAMQALESGLTIHEVPEDIQAFADMTIRELIQRFGTDTAFCDWLKATKSIEDINEKRLKNAVTQGELVSRELIKVGVIEPIDACHIKLLTDGAKTISRRVMAMHSAERGLDEVEDFVKDQITSFIRPVKAKVARNLKNA